MSRILVVSSDCHAGALPQDYREYMPTRYHAAADAWWLQYAREMMKRMGTFFDQEAADEFARQSGEQGAGRMDPGAASKAAQASDVELWDYLCDPDSIIAPQRGEYDATMRLSELDGDGIAGEVVFPQMAPFGGGLMQYRHPHRARAQPRRHPGLQPLAGQSVCQQPGPPCRRHHYQCRRYCSLGAGNS